MTEYVCETCGKVIGENDRGVHFSKARHPCSYLWDEHMEKLARDKWNDSPHRRGHSIEHARLWVIENVLKAGWTHDE